jgi:hypothetical protein
VLTGAVTFDAARAAARDAAALERDLASRETG